MVTQRDYYEILGVDKNASKEALKKAYRKKALEFHPDRNKSTDAEKKFKEVNEAYEILSDEKKRQAYDQFGHAAFDPRAGFGGAGGGQTYRQGPFTYTYRTSGSPFEGFGDFSDPFEIFEQFFGSGSPFGRQYQAKPHYSLKVSFMEAIKGTEKKIVHQGKEHSVKIPAGAHDGTRIRFAEFDVSVDVGIHDTFKRDGYDIFVTVEIPFTKAILGDTIEVPTVEETVQLKVRPGTQPGTLVRLKGRGVPHLRGSGKGDQYVRLNVAVPTSLSKKQKQLVQELDKTLK